MTKAILASLTGFSSDRTVLDAAVAVASIEGGHVKCLHTRIDVVEMAALYKSLSPSHIATSQQISSKIAQEEQERSAHAKAEFEGACKRYALAVRERPIKGAGLSIAWKEVETFSNETLHEARYHDVIVMARDSELSRERIISILMHSGRPLLLAPPKPVPVIGRKVAIAWKAGPEVARALTASSFTLSRAEQIAILCVPEGSPDDDRGVSSAERLAEQFRWRGQEVEVHVQEGGHSASQKIRDMAYGCGADLLVMGAYGHNRMREFVFGGVTREMLLDCALPVLMVH